MEITKKKPVCEENAHIDKNHEMRIAQLIPNEDRAVDIADVFRQLSDSTRIRMLAMLALESICVCEMADILEMSQPCVSHHLRSLRQSGIVRFKKEGKRALYSLNMNGAGRIVKHILNDIMAEERN